MPPERITLMVLATLGCMLIASITLLVRYTLDRGSFPTIIRTAIVIGLAPLTGLVWADVLAHHAKDYLIGSSYNPYDMSIGEFEGWNGPTKVEDVELWRAVRCGTVPYALLDGKYVKLAWWGDVRPGTWCHKQVGEK